MFRVSCFVNTDLRKQKSIKAVQPPPPPTKENVHSSPLMMSMPMNNVAGEVLSDWVDTRDEFEINGVGESLNTAVDKGIHLQRGAHSRDESSESTMTSSTSTTAASSSSSSINDEPIDADEFDNNADELVQPKTNRSAIKTLNQFVDNYNVYRVRTILQAVHVPIFLPSDRKPKTKTTTTSTTTTTTTTPTVPRKEPSKSKSKSKSKSSKNKSKTLADNKTSSIEPAKANKT